MRKALVTGLLVLLLTAPGVAATDEETTRLESRVAALEAKVQGQSFINLRVESRLRCLEQALRGYGKCSTRTLVRR